MLCLAFVLGDMLRALLILSPRSMILYRQLLVVVAEAPWMRSWQRSRPAAHESRH